MPTTITEPNHIFGYVDPSTCYVDSELVPEKHSRTWNTKNGITHFDLFGYICTGSMFTWRCIGSRVEWYAEPDEEFRFRVDDHLHSRYKRDNATHVWY